MKILTSEDITQLQDDFNTLLNAITTRVPQSQHLTLIVMLFKATESAVMTFVRENVSSQVELGEVHASS